MSPPDNPAPDTAAGARFTTTSWTEVLAAKESGSPQAAEALEKLCSTYWYPLYAYARRKGSDCHKAQDLTQEFFYKLIKQNYLSAVDRTRGRFRSFLLASFSHFISNQRDYELAAKRGGRVRFISLDHAAEGETRFLREPRSELSPERIFERNWFLTLFDQALATLRQEQAAGREELLDQLKEFVIRDPEQGDYQAAAQRLNMTPNAVAVTVHRWRERYRKILREEIVRTVGDPSEVEDELRRFFLVLEQQ